MYSYLTKIVFTILFIVSTYWSFNQAILYPAEPSKPNDWAVLGVISAIFLIISIFSVISSAQNLDNKKK